MPTRLEDSAPRTGGVPAGGRTPLLEVDDLHVHYAISGSFVQRLLNRDIGAVRAVDGVSFTLYEGEVLGVVGESGSGKTTLGRAMLGLAAPTSGSIRYRGREVAGLSERAYRPLRRKLQMVFQDPHASLNPGMDLATALAHPLRIHGATRSGAETDASVRAALERVGLVPVERFLRKYPSDLSGGQKQRAVIARAIILGPELLVADEPVSMLDMSVRAKILELMLDLRRDLNLTYLYITHDLATAKFFCDRVAIMYLGRIVEIGSVEQIYADPRHPYTRALLSAIPEPDPTKSIPRDVPRGEIPDASRRPMGCSFHPRCPRAFEVCGWESRDLRNLLEQRWVETGEQVYEQEQALVANLGELDEPSTDVTLQPARGHDAGEILALLQQIRSEHPEEPLWRGVRELARSGDGVRVRFWDGVDPGLLDADGVLAACLLHDPGSRRRAEELSGQARLEEPGRAETG